MDIAIVAFYFALVMFVALRGKQGKDATIDDYFLGSRNLKWYSIAFSTIAQKLVSMYVRGNGRNGIPSPFLPLPRTYMDTNFWA